ncbi:Nif3-like dinuclear metal center hexameric protein [Quadrisphaera sp. DSM 44207]|uniref:Nif3-like dinuclear metal center hexameric protein n=1 Tax=Quadrisphaera sp. DSM 44207 TaxID=1881057 RepID=UPI000884052F|nr:Nif3-like dinuclear metal center hexameric protein [Quadrisphaera sp. DSM 44207]SDQ04219.1 dinuclear metal center protein, YbgI/SA1388 family [Quadrisphaera sp. DSM 44207]
MSPAPTVADVVAVLERLYPPRWAADWDRVGLVCGDPRAPVERILLAVDPTADVAAEAVAAGADLLLVHHPLLLRGVHSVAADTPKGRVVHDLVRAGCALYAAHTNADSARPGVSDALARVLGLTDLVPLSAAPSEPTDKLVVFLPREGAGALLDALAAAGAGGVGQYERVAWTTSGTGTFVPGPGADPAVGEVGRREQVAEERLEVVLPRARREAVLAALRAAHPFEEPAFDVLELAPWSAPRGLGRVGVLERPVSLRAFAQVVADALPATAGGVRASGDPDALVERVAVCGGAGDGLLGAARASGADVLVTADLRHHPASEAREAAGGGPPYLVDVAHWASEWPWLNGAAERLSAALAERGASVTTTVSQRRTDPWTFHVASTEGPVR